MRRGWMVVALGAFLGGTPAHAWLVAVKPVHDFGTVEQGTAVQHRFALRNAGKRPIRIEGVSSSCGCTAAASDGQVVPPKRYSWVWVTLDTAKLSGQTTKTVTLRTSDARTPQVQLALTGWVFSDLVVTPTPIYLGRVWWGEPVRRELRIGPGRPGAPTYTASMVRTDSPALLAWLAPGDKPGEQKVMVELTLDAPSGRFNDEITIHTTSPRQPVIRVPVFGHVLG